jgi:hypothetical protein
MTSLPDELLGFAEDPHAFVQIGPDEERILTDRYFVTFAPGEHFWSTSVQRLRFGEDDVEEGAAQIHDLMHARGRTAAAWMVGPSATPSGLVGRLLGLGMESASDHGSVILVLTEAPRMNASTRSPDHPRSIERDVSKARVPSYLTPESIWFGPGRASPKHPCDVEMASSRSSS